MKGMAFVKEQFENLWKGNVFPLLIFQLLI